MWVFEPGKCVKNFGGTKKKALGLLNCDSLATGQTENSNNNNS